MAAGLSAVRLFCVMLGALLTSYTGSSWVEHHAAPPPNWAAQELQRYYERQQLYHQQDQQQSSEPHYHQQQQKTQQQESAQSHLHHHQSQLFEQYKPPIWNGQKPPTQSTGFYPLNIPPHVPSSTSIPLLLSSSPSLPLPSTGYIQGSDPQVNGQGQTQQQQQQQQQQQPQQQQNQQQQYPSTYETASYAKPRLPYSGPFVPAPPGKRPYCAKKGYTFCETVDYYPANLILSLLQSGKYDPKTLLVDESPDLPPIESPYSYDYQYHYNYTEDYKLYGEDTYYPYGKPTNNQNSYNKNYSKDPSYNANPYSHSGYPSAYPPKNYLLYGVNYSQPVAYDSGNLGENKYRGKRQASSGDSLCSTRRRELYIRAAMDNRGEWFYVANLPELGQQRGLTQRVYVTECSAPGRPCERDLCTPPSGFTTRCEQQYVQSRLISLTETGTQLRSRPFVIPTACVCRITPPN